MAAKPVNSSETDLESLKTLEAIAAQLDLLEQGIGSLVAAFRAAGHRFYVVGGWVRDLLLSTHPDLVAKSTPDAETTDKSKPVLKDPALNDPALNDIDVTTDAQPDEIERLLADWAETVWTAGIAFGTVNGRRGSFVVEITTHRGEQYQQTSRKPSVTFSEDIKTDLGRRDFTINAFAIELPNRHFVDPYNGLDDLKKRVLQTPNDPIQLFSEDPLRILRAARFTASLSLQPASPLVAAMRETCDRLAIVSAERVSMELQKILALPKPGRGVALLEHTGVLTHLGVTRNGQVSATELAEVMDALLDHDVRWAGLAYLGEHSPSQARELLHALRYSKAVCKHVESILLALHDLQKTSQEIRSTSQTSLKPTARQLMATHGNHLQTSEILCATVRRERSGANVVISQDLLNEIHHIEATEEVPQLGKPLNGKAVLSIARQHGYKLVGSQIGDALYFLMTCHFNEGPLSPERAEALLVKQLINLGTK